MTAIVTGNRQHSFAERGLDLYETPACATEALLRAEPVPLDVWEPAAGRGAIVRVLRAVGHEVIASDIADYGFPLDFQRNFLTETEAPADVECILTNPPFKWAEQFVAHALELCPVVIMLLRFAFWPAYRQAEAARSASALQKITELLEQPDDDVPPKSDEPPAQEGQP
jgi:hypothetical protein